MLVLGCDPGPDNYAWTLYEETDTERSFVVWGECSYDTWPNIPQWPKVVAIGIEQIQTHGHVMSNVTLKTCENVGRLNKMFDFLNKKVFLLPRKAIAARLTDKATSGDKEINAAVNQFVPSFAKQRRGLNGHHRAAAAVALVTYGEIQKQEVLRFAQ